MVYHGPTESEVPKRGPGDYLMGREEARFSAVHHGLRTLQGMLAPSAWPSLPHFHRRDKSLIFPCGHPGQFRADRTGPGHHLSFLCHSRSTVGTGTCLPIICRASSLCQAPHWVLCHRDGTFWYVLFAHFTHEETETQQFPPPSFVPYSCNAWMLCIWNFLPWLFTLLVSTP